MKNFTLLTIVMFLTVSMELIPTESQAQRVHVNLSIFRNELGRYGRWMMHPRFGEVWIYNEPGFRPYYSNGYWEYGEEGWEWESDYEWGWAAFHYGRWELDSYYGWLWIPGYEWAPAWVSWSEGSDYYGWAPMGFGVNVNIRIGDIAGDRWVFCPRNRIHERGFWNYCAPYSQYRRILPTISFINIFGGRERNYWAGPERREAERYVGRTIERRDYGNRYENRNRYYENGRQRPAISRPYFGTENRPAGPSTPPPSNGWGNENRGGYGNRNGQGQGQTDPLPAERGRSYDRPAPREPQRRDVIERPHRGRD